MAFDDSKMQEQLDHFMRRFMHTLYEKHGKCDAHCLSSYPCISQKSFVSTFFPVNSIAYIANLQQITCSN